ncbi:MAG: molybdopterin-dependent oxidoreductase [Coriobacteriia bacterium]|nr:molybdopterin-dependent oxidoreductase [Coriobacteriia bacterium]
MKRVGERGSGEWERISWDEAISTIAEKWKEYRSKYGNQSLSFYWGSGATGQLAPGNATGLMGRLVNVLEFTNIDYCVDLAMSVGVGWVSASGALNDITNVKYSDRVVLWGCSLSDAWWQFWKPVADAMENGTRLITVDPNFSTSASKSDLWISNRPGSDPLLILSLMQYIIEHDLHNKDFLIGHTNASFMVRSDNGKILRMSDLGQEPTEGPVNPYTGQPTIIDPPVVWDEETSSLQAWNVATKPTLHKNYVHEGLRLDTAFDLVVAELQNYKAEKITELVGVPVDQIELLALEQTKGNVWNLTGMASQAYKNGAVFGQVLVCLNLITGSIGRPGATVGAAWRFFSMNGAVLTPTGTTMTNVPVLGLNQVMDSGKFKGQDWPIKALYVAAANPVSCAADYHGIKSWWDRIEFIVVADLQFTDSVKYADLVLPVAHALETEDVKTSGYFPFIGISEKAIEPLFEAKTDGDIARLLAEQLGVGEHFRLSNDEFLRDRIDNAPAAKAQNITLDRLRKEKDIYLEGPGTAFEGGYFPTETGKANLYCEMVAPRLNWGQDFDPTAVRVPRFFPPHESWPTSEAMKKYPMALMSERLRTRWHTNEYENEWLAEIGQEPLVKINPIDAVERGITDGSLVEVFNDRGHAVVKAEFSDNIRPGVLLYPKSWQQHEFKAGGWTELTSSFPDPLAVNTSFMDVAADIRPWREEA